MSFRKIICHSGICRQGCNLLASTLVPMSHDPRIHPATASWNCIKFCTSVPFPWFGKLGAPPIKWDKPGSQPLRDNCIIAHGSTLHQVIPGCDIGGMKLRLLWYLCHDMTFTLTKLKLCLHSTVYNSAYFMYLFVRFSSGMNAHEQVIPSSERAQLLCFHGILFHELSL